jgi:hypothetical protein
MDANAYPEQRYVVTDADIEVLRQDEAKKVSNKTDEGFGGFGGGSAAPSQAPGASSTSTMASKEASQSRPQSGAFGAALIGSVDQEDGIFGKLVSMTRNLPLSGLEIAERETRRKILKYKRDRLLKVNDVSNRCPPDT